MALLAIAGEQSAWAVGGGGGGPIDTSPVNAGDAVKLLLVFFLVALNGFFVAAEFAIVKVRSTRIEQLADEGSRRAKMAQHVVGRLDAYLSATQLGITIASILLGAIGEETMRRLVVGPLLSLLHVDTPWIVSTVSFIFGHPDDQKHSSRSAPTLELRTEITEGGMRIRVADNGPGISGENLKRIYEPYFTTKVKGTGLGLAIVSRIVEEHGGELNVNSQPDRGTVITMTFPLAERPVRLLS